MEKQLKLGGCLDWVRPQASILSPTVVKSRPLGKSVCLTPSMPNYLQKCNTVGLFFLSGNIYIHMYMYNCRYVRTHMQTTPICLYIHTLIHTVARFCVYGCNSISWFRSLSVSAYQLSPPSSQQR